MIEDIKGCATLIAGSVLLVIVAAILAGCSARQSIIEERIVRVSKPVTVPCATTRPAAVAPLKEQFPPVQWKGMDVSQKAAAVAHKGLERQTYGEKLNAATAGCREAVPALP